MKWTSFLRVSVCFGMSLYPPMAVCADSMGEPSQHNGTPPGGQSMQENIVSAEVEPLRDCAREAASLLQRLGFRILHVGTTISVQGPESLWMSVFKVSFETRKKTIMADVKGGEIAYRKALDETLTIPPDLQKVVAAVAFVEPPELYYQKQP